MCKNIKEDLQGKQLLEFVCSFDKMCHSYQYFENDTNLSAYLLQNNILDKSKNKAKTEQACQHLASKLKYAVDQIDSYDEDPVVIFKLKNTFINCHCKPMNFRSWCTRNNITAQKQHDSILYSLQVMKGRGELQQKIYQYQQTKKQYEILFSRYLNSPELIIEIFSDFHSKMASCLLAERIFAPYFTSHLTQNDEKIIHFSPEEDVFSKLEAQKHKIEFIKQFICTDLFKKVNQFRKENDDYDSNHDHDSPYSYAILRYVSKNYHPDINEYGIRQDSSYNSYCTISQTWRKENQWSLSLHDGHRDNLNRYRLFEKLFYMKTKNGSSENSDLFQVLEVSNMLDINIACIKQQRFDDNFIIDQIKMIQNKK